MKRRGGIFWNGIGKSDDLKDRRFYSVEDSFLMYGHSPVSLHSNVDSERNSGSPTFKQKLRFSLQKMML
jgi:hypothetical protein